MPDTFEVFLNEHVALTPLQMAEQAVKIALLAVRAYPDVPVKVSFASNDEMEAMRHKMTDRGVVDDNRISTASCSWETPK